MSDTSEASIATHLHHAAFRFVESAQSVFFAIEDAAERIAGEALETPVLNEQGGSLRVRFGRALHKATETTRRAVVSPVEDVAKAWASSLCGCTHAHVSICDQAKWRVGDVLACACAGHGRMIGKVGAR